MGKPSKLRVEFDRKVLNKHQRTEGLKRSWVYLKPNIKTISDLQSHLQKSFCLDKKCPNGVVFYMDDFMLPPFEPTCMLNENDIISVRKKVDTQIDSIVVGDKPLAITEAGENSNGQKQKIHKVLCLHNEKGIHTGSDLDSKEKRGHSNEIPSPNKTIVDDVVGGSTHGNGSVAKVQYDNQQFGINNKLLKQQETEQNTEIEKETAPPVPSDRQWQTQEDQMTNNWNWPANKEKQNYESVSRWNQSNAPSNHQYCNRNQKSTSKWGDHTNNGNQNDARNIANGHNGQKWNWSNKNYKKLGNGTTSKWNDAVTNKEQSSGNTSKWNDAVNNKELCDGTTSNWNDVLNNKEQSCGNTSKWDDASINYVQSNRKEIVPLNEKKGSSPRDFENLLPLTRIPLVGDLLAYRLIEISPSWCPSITPFRIGEVTSYNYLTLNIVLVPVPEYPIFTADIQKSSQYKEDGILQIQYPSLIDVRLFKAFDSFETSSKSFGSTESEKNPQKAKTASVNNWELALANSGSNVKEIAGQAIENGNASGGSTWDKHLVNENATETDQNKKEGWGEWTSDKSASSNSWKNGWSEWNASRWGPQQATRGRGMGPTRGSFRGGRGKGKQ